MCGFWDGFSQARFHPIIIVAARFVPSYNVASYNCTSSTVWNCRSSQCGSPAARFHPILEGYSMGIVAARSQHSHELGSVWSFICVCCEMELLCYDVLVGGGESGENKTVPQHPPSCERAWTKGVGDCNE